nr:hypothetical protein [Tanacetum cinerariifolium]
RATSPTDPSDVERTEAKQLKIVLRRSRQETHISQHGGFSTDEGTGSKPGVSEVPSNDSEEEISWNSFDDEDEDESFDPIPRTLEESEDDGNGEEDQGGRGLQVSHDIEDSHVTLTPTHSDGQQESSSISSFMTNLLNLIFNPASQPPIPPTPIPSDVLQTLPTFTSVFRFEDRVKSLEINFSEFMRTNQSTEAVSNIPGLVHQYMHQEMMEAVREAVQTQTDWLQDSIQRENNEFLRTIDDNMKKIIKKQVKSQVKAQVTRILPRIEVSVNAQLEAEVLTRSSHSSRTSYAALVEAYDADKNILDTYGESAILKKRHEKDDDQEGPSAGSDRGSKRRREGGEHASASTPSEPTTEKDPLQTTYQMKEPSHPVFETGAEDQPIVQTSQHPEWFSQPRRPPTPDRDWLRLQDIEDMLLLLVQGKLSNLTVQERFAFNVSLRMFTRSIVFQRRVEDLQPRPET